MRLLALLILLTRLTWADSSDTLLLTAPSAPITNAPFPKALYLHGGLFFDGASVGLTAGNDLIRLDLEHVRKREFLYPGDFPETRTSTAVLVGLPLADINILSVGVGWAEGVRRGGIEDYDGDGSFGFGSLATYRRIEYREPVLALRAVGGYGSKELGFGLSTRFGVDFGRSGNGYLLQMEMNFGRLGGGLLSRKGQGPPPSPEAAL